MGAIVSGYNKLGQKQVAQHLLGQYSDMDVHKTVENFTLIFKKKKKKKKKKIPRLHPRRNLVGPK